jgi:hypothetical protein
MDGLGIEKWKLQILRAIQTVQRVPGSWSGAKRPERGADHTPPPNKEVVNG